MVEGPLGFVGGIQVINNTTQPRQPGNAILM
ncbi:hypothetical protein NKDENANG_04152 [Candidatus Entotheonellaceae bacterium PAL068K]